MAPTQTEKVYAIPRRDIEADPNQPRKTFTATDTNALAKSIESDGQQDPILVRPHPDKKEKYMLIDGERRWRAAEVAGLKTLDALIETDKLEPADILVRQAQLNSGLAFTPIEEARVCFTLANAPYNLKQTEIADRLGLPRTTVGDRIRMMSLPKVWLNAIESGKLTTSHAALIQPYTAIPAKHHAEIAKAILEDELAYDIEEGRTPALDDFDGALYTATMRFLHPLTGSEVGFNPKLYTGAEVTRKPAYGGAAQRMAADPELWQPLVEQGKKEREKKRRAERAETPAKKAAAERPLIKVPDTVERKRGGTYQYQANQIGDGFIAIYGAGTAQPRKGWYFGTPEHVRTAFDPETFMARGDPEKCVLIEGESHQGRYAWLATRDKPTLQLARKAAEEEWNKREQALFAQLGTKLTKAIAGDGFDVAGAGTTKLIGRLVATPRGYGFNPNVPNLYYLARASGLEMPELRRDQYGHLVYTPLVAALTNINALDAARLLSFWLAWDQKKDPEDWLREQEVAFLGELNEVKWGAWTGGTATDEAEVERDVAKEGPKTTRTERTRTTTRAVKRDKRATASAGVLQEALETIPGAKAAGYRVDVDEEDED